MKSTILRSHERRIQDNGVSDGRNARRDINITRVVDAALELFAEQQGVPRIDEISARAGLSSRSLYRYFDDAASLYFYVAQQRFNQIQQQPRASFTPDTSLRDRAAILAVWRWPAHDQLRNIGDALRRYQDSHEAIAKLRQKGSEFIREIVEDHFRPELDRMGSNRFAMLAALRTLWSVEAWSVLSFDMAHDQETVSQIVITATVRLLGSCDEQHA